MTKIQKNNLESRMWETFRRIDQYDRRMDALTDEITEAEEAGETERADLLNARWERRLKYLNDKRCEYDGMLTVVKILGYRVHITVNDDGRPTDLTLVPNAE